MKVKQFLLASLFAISTSHAGSFFGPPPFTNGSPLKSGVAGRYQATISGDNLLGIIRFSYGTDGNLSALSSSDYIVFVYGTASDLVIRKDISGVITGSTQPVIADNTIAGILETPANPTLTSPNADTCDITGGEFTASINKKSPFYSFSGNGKLSTFISGITYTLVTLPFNVSGMRTSMTP